MERILSREEIAELLTAVREEEVDPESEPPGRSVQPLNLLRLAGRSRWKIPNLDLVFDAFGRNFGVSLTNKLRRSVAVRLEGTESMPCDRLIQALPAQVAIGLLRLEPFRAAGLLIFDGPLSFSLVEILMGGVPVCQTIPAQRSMTAIEMHLISGLMGEGCGDLQKAFRPVEKVQASLVRVENNPRLVQVVQPDTGMLIARYAVSVDNLSGEMSLVIPHPALDLLREKFRDGFFVATSSQDDIWPTLLEAELVQVRATVTARLAEVALTVREIINFQAGDIIDLGRQPDDPVDILIEGKPKFSAQAGVSRGKKAVRITHSLEEVRHERQ